MRVQSPPDEDELSFDEFLELINNALPTDWQLHEDYLNAWSLINQIERKVMRSNNNELQTTMWQVKEELRNALMPQVRRQCEDEIRNEVINEYLVRKIELEKKEKDLALERKYLYDKTRAQVIEEIKRGVDLI